MAEDQRKTETVTRCVRGGGGLTPDGGQVEWAGQNVPSAQGISVRGADCQIDRKERKEF